MTDLLNQSPVIPVVEIEAPSSAVPLCEVLHKGGINAIEVTLRTANAVAAIKEIKAHMPNMILGIGTLLTPDHVTMAEDAGADFLVSPGLHDALIARLKQSPLLTLPGVATPSEALVAYNYGFEKLKLFPASVVGGESMLKAIGGPMPHIKFMPTGGVRPTNMQNFLRLPNVYSVGGTWIAKRDDINSGAWNAIERNAKEAMDMARSL